MVKNHPQLNLIKCQKVHLQHFVILILSPDILKEKKKILDFFLKGDFINKSELISIRSLKNELEKYQLKKIDILKIDTEGFELNVLEGLGDKIKDVKLIYFEHHFDNMIMKNYTYTMIHSYLSKFNFKKVFKIKMPLRKTFEYIYQNKNFH